MINLGVVGLGKMGVSHFALANAHPSAQVSICDSAGYVLDVLNKYLPNGTFKDFDAMLDQASIDAIVIATPSRSHDALVRKALERNVHVFCEKPFCLDWKQSFELAATAEQRQLVNQVGYHYRYVGAFREMKRILDCGALGDVTHVLAEAYGPVVLNPKRSTWRTQKSEGGGCLYDYAAHPINLLNWCFGVPDRVRGSVLRSIFSADTDDEVCATLIFPKDVTAQLSVNWSDESHRKMSTKMAVLGTNGRLYADRQECQLYMRKPVASLPEYTTGWNVKYTTELSDPSWFYLRGEEYSNQIDDFIRAVVDARTNTDSQSNNPNDFRSAAETDRTIAMIVSDNSGITEAPDSGRQQPKRKAGWFART